VNGCITTIRENIRNNQLLNGIINSNRIDKMIADINSKLVQYNAARSRNRVNMKSAVISSIEYLLMDYLYNKINGEIHKITAINENINDSVGSLSPQEKNTVQHISRLVAKNTIEYIIADSNKTDKLLEDSYDILKSIADKNIGYSTLDNKLRESFIEYARENNHQVVLTNSDEISQEIQKAKKNKMLIRTINNAATAQITKLKIDTNTEIICPTSSVVDAMGAMGSCYQLARNDRKKEYYNMDFMMITNIEGNNDFYQGSTILSENNNRLTIQYSATINDFILPYVTIPIDITTPKILSLSAGQTFKSVLQKIILIWMNSFQSTFAPSEEQLWQTLENKKIYEYLASVGSIKSVGDFFQEINSVVVNGGYSANGVVQPTQFRIGANGDQPSGVRAGFILLNATANSLHDNSMAGYLGENGEDDNVVILNLRQTKISSKPVEASIQPKNPSKASIQPKNPSKASSKKTKGGKKTKKIRYATYKKSRKNL
jgi:hypothetical protein